MSSAEKTVSDNQILIKNEFGILECSCSFQLTELNFSGCDVYYIKVRTRPMIKVVVV